nr:uncharacterized protein LOC106731654 [Pelodiscus sinensis]|eukprot:XP_014426613.1 uncharacterized protein LOC106731654 [Pelodiscus sinensis]
MSQAYGAHGSHDIRRRARKTALPLSPALDSYCLHSKCSRRPQTSTISCSRQKFFSMVDSSQKSDVGCSISSPTADNTADHRCIVTRLGRTSGTQSGTRALVPSESMMHINLLELRVVRNACRHFLPKIRTQTVRILSDNMTTVYYINRQGGARSRSLCAEAIALWDWCILHKISLIAEYLPGQQNSMADALSRRFSLKHEWELQPEVLSTIFRSWGFPTVDLFATRMNAKCPQYCSRAGMGRNSKGDVFLYDWSHQLLYAWPRQTWFPYLHQMSVRPPFPLPKRRDLLVQNNQRLFHPQIDLLALTAWFLVGSNKQK